MCKFIKIPCKKEGVVLTNRLNKFAAFFFAVLIFSGMVFQFASFYVNAEETDSFSQSAYTFEYENLLLDVGDGTYPLLAKEGDYATVTGRGGSTAVSNGAILDPALFSGKTGLAFSFWTVFNEVSVSSGPPYTEARSLLSTLQERLAGLDESAYTDISRESFANAVSELQNACDSVVEESELVDKMEAAISAEKNLVIIYSATEASSVLSEAESIDLNQYTPDTAAAVSNGISVLASAISSSASNISELTNALLVSIDALEYTDYLRQAEKEYNDFQSEYESLITSVYTTESLENLENSLSALRSSIDNSENDSVLRSRVSSVNEAFFRLTAIEATGSGSVSEIFEAYADDSHYIRINQSGSSVAFELNLGSRVYSYEYSVASYAGSSEFMMITFTIDPSSSSNSTFCMYINGSRVGRETISGRISGISFTDLSFKDGFSIDDIYVASRAISSDECGNLYGSSMEDFLLRMDPSWVKPSDRIEVNPVTNFKWSAYTFDDGFKIDSDLNGVANCSYNAILLAPIETSDYGGSFGMGLARRSRVYPSHYLSLEAGLIYSASSFTVAGYVYTPSGTTTASFFDFSGRGGRLVFSPFSVDSSGQANGYFEYTDSEGGSRTVSFSGGGLGNINSNWTHYAFSFAENGDVTIYVNGESAATINTGMRVSDFEFTSLKIISGITSGESARIIIDDIYISSRVMSDSDIRKIAYYGVERFVGEVLPDPETGEIEIPEENVDLSADETDALEDEYSDSAAINGYVGTTFDNSSFMGEDYNGSVSATIRNASLVQGLYKYGLNLNGNTSYLRYPMGIFDSVSELTVSVAYNWVTPSTVGERTQKLFSFSKKSDSVSDPTAYIYLDMGNGTDGMSLRLSDGSTETELQTSVNSVGEWKRVTVTIKDGNVKLYLDADLIAQKSTDIDLTAIAPNFNYIGKSGYKGDPLFCGVVDEIYMSDREISVDEIENLMTGIDPASENSENSDDSSGDVWDWVIIIALVFMGLLLAGFIALVVYILFFKK